MNYEMNTKKNWLQTKEEIENEFARWGVTDFILTPANQNIVTCRFIVHGKEILLTSGNQPRPADNLRVIYYTIHSMRLNELRGMSEIFESAYMQLAAPVIEKDPYDVLGLPRGTAKSVCEAQFKELAKHYHPDQGGDPVKFKEVNDAIEKIRAL